MKYLRGDDNRTTPCDAAHPLRSGTGPSPLLYRPNNGLVILARRPRQKTKAGHIYRPLTNRSLTASAITHVLCWRR